MAGFFGSISTTSCVADVFYGTDYHSHLGTRRAGMVTYDPELGFKRAIHSLENAYFRSKFEEELPKFRGNSGMGIISDTDAQPQLFNSHLGRFAICTVAKILNLEEIAQQLLEEGMHLTEFSSGRINPTEVVGCLIVKGNDFVDGIENVFRKVKGSCSMLILTEDGIIAARDSWGRTPIIIGHRDGAYAATSETTAFPNLGYETEKFVGAGEIVKIKADGYEVLRKANKRMQICAFLWVYYGFPISDYEGRNTEEVRNACGEAMGKDDDTEVDCACGIPDSGVGMAVGYAAGHKCPYMRAISKYTPTWPRSFTPSNQEMRNLVAKMKLIQNRAILKDKRVLFCDDSIVRGTQLRDNTACLYEAGAKEVHMRIACPPLVYGCKFINFTSSRSDMELITRRIIAELEGEDAAQNPERLKVYATTDSPEYKKMVEIIKDRFNLTSLKFTKLEDLIAAIGLDKSQICTHCFDGSSEFTLNEVNLDNE
ncbi:MAG: amidophosphoribosyltransferase [Bacteroidales bacterium]|nr:amidophosphoribosyltransferase [Candidatus Liminaster caballi]